MGKSTLARSLVSKSWNARYVTLDELSPLDAARSDPDGFVRALPLPVILDEIQRVPDLLRSVKLRVDREPGPGLFLLTGSANVLTMASVSETLAGRVAVHELHPFAWAETSGVGSSPVLADLFEVRGAAEAVSRWPQRGSPEALEEVKASIGEGGYPRPVLMKTAAGRRTWFDSYRKTYVERDLRELSQLAHLPEFSRLLTLLALRTADIVNVAEVSRSTTIPATTLSRGAFSHRDLSPSAATRPSARACQAPSRLCPPC
ncbi:MAG: AAA family ATPase [Candidatus Riflebacteria bacterium]|nr:AAA family ATPase [Candidatus Riflebacteria bacterium]